MLASDAVGYDVGPIAAVSTLDSEGPTGPTEREGALASPSVAAIHKNAAHSKRTAPDFGLPLVDEWGVVPDMLGASQHQQSTGHLDGKARHDQVFLQHPVQ